jgi:hypothetical protein
LLSILDEISHGIPQYVGHATREKSILTKVFAEPVTWQTQLQRAISGLKTGEFNVSSHANYFLFLLFIKTDRSASACEQGGGESFISHAAP